VRYRSQSSKFGMPVTTIFSRAGALADEEVPVPVTRDTEAFVGVTEAGRRGCPRARAAESGIG